MQSANLPDEKLAELNKALEELLRNSSVPERNIPKAVKQMSRIIESARQENISGQSSSGFWQDRTVPHDSVSQTR